MNKLSNYIFNGLYIQSTNYLKMEPSFSKICQIKQHISDLHFVVHFFANGQKNEIKKIS